MSGSNDKSETLALALELIDDLSTEIDLYYEDGELAEANTGIEAIRELEEALDIAPSAASSHIQRRFEAALEKKPSSSH